MTAVGGVVIFNYLTNNQSVSLASKYSIPTSTPITPSVIPSPTVTATPTEIPVPTTPIISVTPTKPGPITQILKASYGPPLGLDPTEFNVKANIPVRLEVYANVNGRGCMGSITIPDFTNEVQVFAEGETNLFEFTPQIPGTYPIICAMGIPHGFIKVE